jgi:hypothetical protein
MVKIRRQRIVGKDVFDIVEGRGIEWEGKVEIGIEEVVSSDEGEDEAAKGPDVGGEREANA